MSGHPLSPLELLPEDLIVKIAQHLAHSPKSVFSLYTCCPATHTRAVQACISSALTLNLSDPAAALQRLERFPPACTLKKLLIRLQSSSMANLPNSIPAPSLPAIQAKMDALKNRLARVQAIHLAPGVQLDVDAGIAGALKIVLIELCPNLETLSLSQTESHWRLLSLLADPEIGQGPVRLKKLRTHVPPFCYPAPFFNPDMAAGILATFPGLVHLMFCVPEDSPDISPLAQLQHLRVLDLTYTDGEEMLGLHTVLRHTPLQSLSIHGKPILGNQLLSSETLQTITFGSIQENDTFFNLVSLQHHLPRLQHARVEVLSLDLFELEDESQLLSLLAHKPRVVLSVVQFELLGYCEDLLPSLLVVLGPHLACVQTLKLHEPCFESVSCFRDLLDLMPRLAKFESEGGSVDSECLAACVSELAHMPRLFSIKLNNLTRPHLPFLPPRYIVESPVQQMSLSGFEFMRGSIAALSSCFNRLRYLDLKDSSHAGGWLTFSKEARCFPLLVAIAGVENSVVGSFLAGFR